MLRLRLLLNLKLLEAKHISTSSKQCSSICKNLEKVANLHSQNSLLLRHELMLNTPCGHDLQILTWYFNHFRMHKHVRCVLEHLNHVHIMSTSFPTNGQVFLCASESMIWQVDKYLK
jgi:hypothetical protein